MRVCIYIYIINIHSTPMYIMYTTLILDAINLCPPLITFNILCIILIYINM